MSHFYMESEAPVEVCDKVFSHRHRSTGKLSDFILYYSTESVYVLNPILWR